MILGYIAMNHSSHLFLCQKFRLRDGEENAADDDKKTR